MSKKRLILNQQIRANNVRLIAEDGSLIGIVPLQTALDKAKEEGLDLALIATHPETPVVKVIDHGKYQYEQSKMKSKQKAKAKPADVKGIRIGLNTGEHDLEVKRKLAIKFLTKGHPLKVQLQLKGREMMYKANAVEKAQEFGDSLVEEATIESGPKMQGYQVTMIMIPKK